MKRALSSESRFGSGLIFAGPWLPFEQPRGFRLLYADYEHHLRMKRKKLRNVSMNFLRQVIRKLQLNTRLVTFKASKRMLDATSARDERSDHLHVGGPKILQIGFQDAGLCAQIPADNAKHENYPIAPRIGNYTRVVGAGLQRVEYSLHVRRHQRSDDLSPHPPAPYARNSVGKSYPQSDDGSSNCADRCKRIPFPPLWKSRCSHA